MSVLRNVQLIKSLTIFVIYPCMPSVFFALAPWSSAASHHVSTTLWLLQGVSRSRMWMHICVSPRQLFMPKWWYQLRITVGRWSSSVQIRHRETDLEPEAVLLSIMSYQSFPKVRWRPSTTEALDDDARVAHAGTWRRPATQAPRPCACIAPVLCERPPRHYRWSWILPTKPRLNRARAQNELWHKQLHLFKLLSILWQRQPSPSCMSLWDAGNLLPVSQRRTQRKILWLLSSMKSWQRRGPYTIKYRLLCKSRFYGHSETRLFWWVERKT